MKKSQFLALYFTITCLASTTALAYFPDFAKKIEISGAVGINWMQTAKNSKVVISPFETDKLKTDSNPVAALWQVGIGYRPLDDMLEKRKFFNHLLMEANVYYSSVSVSGDVWQYGLAEFNNYHFRAPIKTFRLMLDVKPTLFDYQFKCYTISPYAVFGVGAAWNKISYHETVTSTDIDPVSYLWLSERRNTHVAYDAGLGLHALLSAHLGASLEYLYTYLGPTSSSFKQTQQVALIKPSQFIFNSQSLLLGINWNF